jgi:hypothetical protein
MVEWQCRVPCSLESNRPTRLTTTTHSLACFPHRKLTCMHCHRTSVMEPDEQKVTSQGRIGTICATVQLEAENDRKRNLQGARPRPQKHTYTSLTKSHAALQTVYSHPINPTTHHSSLITHHSPLKTQACQHSTKRQLLNSNSNSHSQDREPRYIIIPPTPTHQRHAMQKRSTPHKHTE